MLILVLTQWRVYNVAIGLHPVLVLSFAKLPVTDDFIPNSC